MRINFYTLITCSSVYANLILQFISPTLIIVDN